MSEANHSPLPWHAPSAGVYTQDGMMVTSCGTHTIVEALRGQAHDPRAIAEIVEANARHIVRCVNAFDDLLAAAQWVLTDADDRGETTDEQGEPYDDYRALRAAIAKAPEA